LPQIAPLKTDEKKANKPEKGVRNKIEDAFTAPKNFLTSRVG
jgi:hypothetical protein